ncbi:MAG TPA: hypothetical protein VFV10_02135 [Gammaproteobacteria bacterium]|nr:hypothetical protein [Gammaproteobacteria bacterium]
MNIDRLREAEAAFLTRFPEGFDDPGLELIRKRHNIDRLSELARAQVTEAALSQPDRFADALIQIVTRSSMVSRFEKPPFKRFVDALDSEDKRRLAEAFRKRLFGNDKREGFEEIVDLFGRYGLARWSLVSALPFYFAPSKEAFVKPSTARKIVGFLDVEDLHYSPRPTWTFYVGYRKLVREIKKTVDPRLTPNNAAATGFLMASL